MRNKLMIAVLSCALLAGFTGLSWAEDVYVTKYGKKYHKEDSRFIKGREVEKLDREEAEELGYKPSSDFLQEKTDSDE